MVQKACDRCTQGVMDADNPHLHDACRCVCHEPDGDPFLNRWGQDLSVGLTHTGKQPHRAVKP